MKKPTTQHLHVSFSSHLTLQSAPVFPMPELPLCLVHPARADGSLLFLQPKYALGTLFQSQASRPSGSSSSIRLLVFHRAPHLPPSLFISHPASPSATLPPRPQARPTAFPWTWPRCCPGCPPPRASWWSSQQQRGALRGAQDRSSRAGDVRGVLLVPFSKHLGCALQSSLQG